MRLLPLSLVLLAACAGDATNKGDDTGPAGDGGGDDTGCADPGTWYADADGDGFGDAGAAVSGCEAPAGSVDDASDCDDGDASRFPGADEVCGDGVVNDCEGSEDAARAACPLAWDLDAARTFTGAGGAAGAAVSMAGDLDGDGRDELVVGAPHAATSQDGAGRVRIVAGGADAGALGDAVATISGEHWRGELGAAVAIVGDTDGDGLDDVLVGAPETYGETGGGAYLYLGPVEGELGPQDGAAALGSGEYGARLGAALAGGDLDGDGDVDLLIGAPDAQVSESPSGRVYLLMGPATVNGFTGEGAEDAAWRGDVMTRDLGAALATGDVDGDGIDDVVVGDPAGLDSSHEVADGRAYLVLGGAVEDLDLTEGSAAATLFGEESGGRFGASVATADVDGDGRADVVVGAPEVDAPDGDADAGRVYVFAGGLAGLVEATEATAALSGGSAERQAGLSVSSGGDVDGDGLEEILVGAPRWLLAEDPGEGGAYLVLGGVQGQASLADAAVTAVSSTGEHLGAAVSSGDFDGDGVPDAALGAPGLDGRALVLLGDVGY